MFKTKTRDEWCAIMEGSDVCFAPVLSLSEVADHPHNKERQTFVTRDGIVQPAPSPRFSRTTAEIAGSPRTAGADSRDVLESAGLGAADIDALLASGAVAEPAA